MVFEGAKKNRLAWLFLMTISLFFSVAMNLWAKSESSQRLMRPLDLRNQYLFYLPYLGMPLEKARNGEEGSQEIKIGLAKSSTFLDYYECEEKGLFDLETTVLSFHYTIALPGAYELRFYLPLIHHGGGFMDPVIEGFHAGFGLPNGGRETWASNEILIERLGEGGQPLISLDRALYGLGDPALYVKKELGVDNPSFSLNGAIKIPLKTEKFVSSNTLDLGLSLNLDYTLGELYFYLGAGGVYFLGAGYYKEELARRQNYTLHAGIGAGIQVSSTVSVFMQFYFQSSPYETGISRVDRVSSVHSFGVRWLVSDAYIFQFSADEDTFTYSTTDIAFAFQLEYGF